MRLSLSIFVSMAFAGIACCQTVSTEEMIRRIIDKGVFEGQMQKHIGRMGDAAAVTVTKVFAGKNLTSNEIDNTLIVLTASFADPRGVEDVSDRQPRTTLFVLRDLESSTRDPELRKRIADIRKYVQEQSAKITQDSPKK